MAAVEKDPPKKEAAPAPEESKAAEVVPADKAPITRTPVNDDVPFEGTITPFEGDYMEITIQVADELERYGKAVDAILNFCIKRSYAGDWISHDRAGTPAEERTVNMSGAAAERIARDLGVQESNRTKLEKVWADPEKHPGHYAYQCEGDFSFRGRKVHAIGNASTLNPFYYKTGGAERKPSDIREEYIERDAWRDCTKQGIKGLFALRRIPLMKLQELGYDISKVKYVNFKEGENSAGAKSPESTAVPGEVQGIQVLPILFVDAQEKTFKSGKSAIFCKADTGIEFGLWRKMEHADAQRILTAIANKERLKVAYKYDGKYRNIESVATLGDAQED